MPFIEPKSSIETYWRAIILIGRNVASYKFALAKSLLEMDGLWEFYQENGQLEFRSNYKDGKWDGFLEFFNEDGLFWFKNCYKNGEEINMSYCYN